MFQKLLFRPKPSPKDPEDPKHTEALLESNSWSPPNFDTKQIRVILCQDTGDKVKLTLFDSAYSLISNPTTKSPDNRDRSKNTTANTSELSSSWSGGGGSILNGHFIQKSTAAINIKSSSTSTTTSNNIINNNNESKRRNLDSVNKKANARTLPPSLNRNNAGLGTPKKAIHNIDLIGEMMFGAVPLSYKGMNTKIHFIKNPKPQILLTKLFSINPADLESSSPGRRSSISSVNSDTSIASSTQGTCTPINITTQEPRSISQTLKTNNNTFHIEDCSESSDDDSYHVVSSYSSPPYFSNGPPILGLRTNDYSISPTSSLSTSPRSTFINRRIRRFSQTSLEKGVFNPTPLPGGMARLDFSSGNISLKSPGRSLMYAIGVVISLEDNELLEEFIFSHFTLLENRLHQLHSAALKLLCTHLRRSSGSATITGPNSASIFNPLNRTRLSLSSLSSLMFQNDQSWLETVNRFKKSLWELYSTPRIQEPLWLNISTFPQRKNKLANSLMTELSYLIQKFDKQSNSFFISTLITSVLMYHLGWVPTVAPATDFDEHVIDLYGNLGTPTLSRTIIIGKDVNMVRRIIFILSYFIRCNEVYENKEQMIPFDSNFNGQKKSMIDIMNETKFSKKDMMNNGETDSYSNNNHYSSDGDDNNKQKRLIIDGSISDLSIENFMDVPIPKSANKFTIPDTKLDTTKTEDDDDTKLLYRADRLFVKSYGRSLMVGHCKNYMSDFVLMGIPNLDDQDLLLLETDLKDSLQQFSLQFTVTKTICILGQLSNFMCTTRGYDLYSARHAVDDDSVTFEGSEFRNSEGFIQQQHYSKYVYNMLHQCKDLFTVSGMSAESASCLEYLEDTLRTLYYKAILYKKLLRTTYNNASSASVTNTTNTTTNNNNNMPYIHNGPQTASLKSIYLPPLSNSEDSSINLIEVLGIDESDIPLIDSITNNARKDVIYGWF
nr:13507_t:CDS:10 [Entrophospora candida]CAG8565883.1 8554_t:CDS:10 [Entrophospora candida]